MALALQIIVVVLVSTAVGVFVFNGGAHDLMVFGASTLLMFFFLSTISIGLTIAMLVVSLKLRQKLNAASAAHTTSSHELGGSAFHSDDVVHL